MPIAIHMIRVTQIISLMASLRNPDWYQSGTLAAGPGEILAFIFNTLRILVIDLHSHQQIGYNDPH